MSQNFKSEIKLEALSNATSDTDRFLVSDSGIIKYRTGAEVRLDIGADSVSVVKHQVKAGVAINKGQAVYVTSADGTNMIVGLASNASEATSSKTMGLLDATVAINGFANVVTEGLLAGLNTSTATAGDPVWLGTGGDLIYGLANKPYAPAHLVFIGIVTRVNLNNGEIFVKVQNGFELDELHNVDLKTTTPINGHLLGFDGTLWVNKTIAGWLGYTPANASGTTNYVSKFTGSTTLGNSLIFDNGTNVGIGTSSPSEKLHISGNSLITGTLEVDTVNNGTGDFLTRTAGGIITRRTAAEVRSDIGAQAALTNPITGTGTTNYISKFTGSTTLGNSLIFDSGTSVLIGTTTDGGTTYGSQPQLTVSSSTGGVLDIRSISTNILSGDVIGRVQFTGKDDASVGYTTAVIQALAGGTLGSGSSPGTLQFMTSPGGGGSSPAERMRITSIGKVGVGTTNPTSRLHSEVSTSGPATYDFLCAIFGYNTSTDTVYNNQVGIAGRVLTSGGKAVYGDATTGSGWGGYFDGKGYFSGNVGIGTTNPPSKLSISGGTLSVSGSGFGFGVVKLGDPTDANPYVGIYRSAAAAIATSGNFLNLGGYDGIAFTTGAAQLSGQPERMRITSAGNVGIGTTSPATILDLGASTGQKLSIYSSGNSRVGFGIETSTLRYYVPTGSIHSFGHLSTTDGTTFTERMRITAGGAMGLGVTPTNTSGRFEASNDIVAYSSSDKRWKNNIKNIDNALGKLSKINGVEFDWIEDEPVHGNKGHDIGVIAQEIEQVLPDIVQTRDSGMKAVQYDKIIPLLIESIKEQQKQIEELKEILNGITK